MFFYVFPSISLKVTHFLNPRILKFQLYIRYWISMLTWYNLWLHWFPLDISINNVIIVAVNSFWIVPDAFLFSGALVQRRLFLSLWRKRKNRDHDTCLQTSHFLQSFLVETLHRRSLQNQRQPHHLSSH